MQKFFKDIQAIDHFTLNLAIHRSELQCVHCSKSDQFVSHGFIYKQRSLSENEAGGKRIFCSNRHGRSGCEHTFQLYIAHEMPSLHYDCTQVFAFVSALLLNLSVVKAYQKATAQANTRHAWRWLHRLDHLPSLLEGQRGQRHGCLISHPRRQMPFL